MSLQLSLSNTPWGLSAARAAFCASSWRQHLHPVKLPPSLRFLGDPLLPVMAPHRECNSASPKCLKLFTKGSNELGPRPRRFRTVAVAEARGRSDAGKDRPSKTERLRELIKSPGIHQAPACYDALSARLVEAAGFPFTFMSGFCVSAARLGLPDAGLISYGEMVDQAALIAGAVSIPLIADGDTGYGNALNVKRTVRGFSQAGCAGVLIEDQVMPKACGHTRGRKVVSREEAVMRIRAAADARDERDGDIVIVARTDARQAVGLEEALWRVEAFADAGADVLFIDALASRDEMKAFCWTAPGVPKMASMLEGGGKTPILNPAELDALGFKLVAYPLSLLGVSIRAMQDALVALRSGRLPPPAVLPSFEEVKAVVGFDEYYEEEGRYAVDASSASKTPSSSSLPPEVAEMAARAEAAGDAARVAAQLAAEEALERARSAGGMDGGTGGAKLFWGGTQYMPGTEISGPGGEAGGNKADVRGEDASVQGDKAGMRADKAGMRVYRAGEGFVWQAGGLAGEGGASLDQETTETGRADAAETGLAGMAGGPGGSSKDLEGSGNGQGGGLGNSAVGAKKIARGIAEMGAGEEEEDRKDQKEEEEESAKGEEGREDKKGNETEENGTGAEFTQRDRFDEQGKTGSSYPSSSVTSSSSTSSWAAASSVSSSSPNGPGSSTYSMVLATRIKSDGGLSKATQPDAVYEDGEAPSTGQSRTTADASEGRSRPSGIWGQTLRVVITGDNGVVKLETRIPAGFLDGFAATIPVFAGVDLRTILQKLTGSDASGEDGGPIVDFVEKRDRIQVFLE